MGDDSKVSVNGCEMKFSSGFERGSCAKRSPLISQEQGLLFIIVGYISEENIGLDFNSISIKNLLKTI